MDLIREKLWLGDESPEGAPDDWTIRPDLRFVRKLWSGEGADQEATRSLEAFLRGARLLADDGELSYRPTPEAAPETLEVGTGFTTALLRKRLEAEPQFYHDAVAAGRKEAAEVRDRYPGKVSEVLDELAARSV